jgi:hypothetical protein
MAFRRTFVSVKWLTAVLAVYLLGLSLWPCADEALPLTGQAQAAMFTATPTAAAASGASHEHRHDQCSPFCTCACCAAATTVITRFSYALTPSVAWLPVAVVVIGYLPLHWADPLTAIWQPPKRRV